MVLYVPRLQGMAQLHDRPIAASGVDIQWRHGAANTLALGAVPAVRRPWVRETGEVGKGMSGAWPSLDDPLWLTLGIAYGVLLLSAIGGILLAATIRIPRRGKESTCRTYEVQAMGVLEQTRRKLEEILRRCQEAETLEQVDAGGPDPFPAGTDPGAVPPPGEIQHMAVLRITHDLLIEALKLPAGTRILDISRDQFFLTDEVALKIEHPSLDSVPPGRPLPVVAPCYRKTHTVHFDGWSGGG